MDQTDVAMLDRNLVTDLNACAKVMEQRLGFPANGLSTVVADYRGIEGVKFSLRRPIKARLLGRMWERDLLRFTVEAIALLPWYVRLFTEEELSEARDRLTRMEFDVGGYVANAERTGREQFTRRLLIEAGLIRPHAQIHSDVRNPL
jgi:hypothetical protein